MKVFVAGASGAIGNRLVPMLVENGHDVVGMTRSRPDAVRSLGAKPVVADALDRGAVIEAVRDAKPDVIVHELTSLTGALTKVRIDRAFEMTNRLRTEGTDNLIAAAQAAGTPKIVAQSYAGWPYARQGGPVKSEDDPLDPDPPKRARPILDAIKHLETAVTAVDGIVLRYGGFYGPGTSLAAEGGEHSELVRKRRFPIIGDGGGRWSLVHIDDAGAATVAAIERGRPGIYNIVDDEPAPMREWMPELARQLGAKPPRRIPTWLARAVAGEMAAVMGTEIRGASNAKAKRELGWTLRYPSWRQGFAEGL